jgi:parvulin-like peptidyl-prolyl isomerase
MKSLIFAFLVSIVLAGCGQDKQKTKLAPESDAYNVAKQISGKVSYLDPDENNVLISCNSFEVTTGEVLDYLVKNYRPQIEQFKALPPEQIDLNIHKFAELLATERIYLDAASKEGVAVDEETIERALTRAKAQAGGPDKFNQWLEARSLDEEYFRKMSEQDLLIKAFMDKKTSEVQEPTEQEIIKAYQADKMATVRHILLSTQGKPDSEKKEIRKKMEDILARAREGEEFAELAREYTDDPGSKQNGGLYESFTRGKMVPEFDEVSFSLPPGEISDIVETTYGYHIIKVIERKRETRPLGEIRNTIVASLKRTRENEIRESLLEGLKNAEGYEVRTYAVESKEQTDSGKEEKEASAQTDSHTSADTSDVE